MNATTSPLILEIITHLPNIFSSLQWNDYLDILIVSFFIYVILIFIQQTRSYFILYTFLLLFFISFLSKVFDLSLTRKLFEPLLTFFVVIFAIVFQREIRRFFRWLFFDRTRTFKQASNITEEISGSIVRAVSEMARQKIGAIIVLAGQSPLDDIAEGGFALDGKISTPLLLSIFDNHTPGHDGAVLIENRRIKKFGLHLPLAENFKGFATMGTRHRAALGITERTDAMAIVVSEERGTISIGENGVLRPIEDADALMPLVQHFMRESGEEHHQTMWEYLVINNFSSKILSLALSFLLWVVLIYFNRSLGL